MKLKKVQNHALTQQIFDQNIWSALDAISKENTHAHTSSASKQTNSALVKETNTQIYVFKQKW